jgi:transposase
MESTSTEKDLELHPAARLEVLEVGDHRVVMLNGHRTAQYRRDDQGTERIVMTQLAEVNALKDRDIAATFSIHPVSLSRFRGLARSGGAASLMPLKPGPKKPSKLTAEMRARILRLKEEERLSCRAIAKRLSRGKRKISHVSVAEVLRKGAEEAGAKPLPLKPKQESVRNEERSESLQVGQSRTSVYAGALMLFAALVRLDLWGALRGLGAQVGAARRFGLLKSVAAIVFTFALRFRSIEDLKNAQRRDFGVLLGECEGPGVQTLRLKLARLSESLEPVALSREMMRRYLAVEPVWEGLYYVDGHFCPYYGHHATPKGWDPHRRLASRGHTDVYVHDVRGRVLFFLSQPLNDSLARAIPAVVEQIRQVHGPEPFTLIFDRGGYSGKLFRWLNSENIGFITYLKGRKARRRYAEDRFQRSWFEFEKSRHVYRIYEKKTRVKGAGLLRTIVWLDETGEQIPVLSNLKGLKPARLIHCLKVRWRQENALKYQKQNYAIDQIVQYGATPEQEERLVDNPKRKKLKSRIARVRKEIEALEAEIGRALEDNQQAKYKTTRGFKVAHARQRRKLAEKRQVLSRLETRLLHTPAKVSASELEKRGQRELLNDDRRQIVNTLKMVTDNAERLLTLQFNHHYKRDKDVFSVFRSLFHLPGKVERVSTNRIDVHLERPQPEKVAVALQSLLDELNKDRPRMFGSGPVLHFSLVC